MKNFYDSKPKWDRKAKEWVCDNADITAISRGNTVDIYATTEDNGNRGVIYVWFDLGGHLLPGTPRKYTEAEKLLVRFALKWYGKNPPGTEWGDG